MNSKNNTWAIVVGVLIVVLILIVVFRNKAGDAIVPAGDTAGTENVTEVEPTEDISEGSIKTETVGTATVTMSYQNALTTYKDARLQFDTTCSMFPSQVTYKVGTVIMLDNRSPEARTIRLGSMGSYSVKGYGFKLVKLSLSGLAVNDIAVDCGARQNAGIIKVQK